MKIKPHYVLIRAVSRGIPACWENCPENLSSNFLHHKHFFWGSEQLRPKNNSLIYEQIQTQQEGIGTEIETAHSSQAK